MLAPETLATRLEPVQPTGSHRAFLSKMERDQKARRAAAHRHQMRWFVSRFQLGDHRRRGIGAGSRPIRAAFQR